MVIIKSYGGYDLNNLEYIGKGIHGKVYKIDSVRCIKIFRKTSFYEKELSTLQMAQNNKHFPKIYEWNEGYIIREYIDGIELDKYLKDNPLTLEMSEKIINLYEALKEVGFKRLDAVLFHIFVIPSGELKLIDTTRVMRKETIYPKLLIDGLKKLGYKNEFMNHLKTLKYDFYK